MPNNPEEPLKPLFSEQWAESWNNLKSGFVNSRGYIFDAGGNVPVIAMTALVTDADRARILNAGFHAWVPKPSSPDALVNAILTVLNH